MTLKRIQERYVLKIARAMVEEIRYLMVYRPKSKRSWALTRGSELVKKLEKRRGRK